MRQYSTSSRKISLLHCARWISKFDRRCCYMEYTHQSKFNRIVLLPGEASAHWNGSQPKLRKHFRHNIKNDGRKSVLLFAFSTGQTNLLRWPIGEIEWSCHICSLESRGLKWPGVLFICAKLELEHRNYLKITLYLYLHCSSQNLQSKQLCLKFNVNSAPPSKYASYKIICFQKTT